MVKLMYNRLSGPMRFPIPEDQRLTLRIGEQGEALSAARFLMRAGCMRLELRAPRHQTVAVVELLHARRQAPCWTGRPLSSPSSMRTPRSL